MKIDSVILKDLLARADEIRHAERVTARQALRQAMKQWPTLEHDSDVVAGGPTALPLPGQQVVKAA